MNDTTRDALESARGKLAQECEMAHSDVRYYETSLAESTANLLRARKQVADIDAELNNAS